MPYSQQSKALILGPEASASLQGFLSRFVAPCPRLVLCRTYHPTPSLSGASVSSAHSYFCLSKLFQFTNSK